MKLQIAKLDPRHVCGGTKFAVAIDHGCTDAGQAANPLVGRIVPGVGVSSGVNVTALAVQREKLMRCRHTSAFPKDRLQVCGNRAVARDRCDRDQLQRVVLRSGRHHKPNSFPPEAIIDHSVYTENLAAGQIVPEPGRENFRFNLWLLDTSPNDNQPVEVVINDFQFFLHGDFDLDGKVDGNDFLKWQQGESPDPFSESDLVAWEQNYGAAAPLIATSTAVPEPATWIVLLIGMMAVLFRRDVIAS